MPLEQVLAYRSVQELSAAIIITVFYIKLTSKKKLCLAASNLKDNSIKTTKWIEQVLKRRNELASG